MFDIGFSELVVIGLIALIVLGPKRLPEVARTAGKWMGQLRRFLADGKLDLGRGGQSRRLRGTAPGELVKGFTEIPPHTATPTIHSSEPPKLAAVTSAKGGPSSSAG